jgi:hypothetical protein
MNSSTWAPTARPPTTTFMVIGTSKDNHRKNSSSYRIVFFFTWDKKPRLNIQFSFWVKRLLHHKVINLKCFRTVPVAEDFCPALARPPKFVGRVSWIITDVYILRTCTVDTSCLNLAFLYVNIYIYMYIYVYIYKYTCIYTVYIYIYDSLHHGVFPRLLWRESPPPPPPSRSVSLPSLFSPPKHIPRGPAYAWKNSKTACLNSFSPDLRSGWWNVIYHMYIIIWKYPVLGLPD